MLKVRALSAVRAVLVAASLVFLTACEPGAPLGKVGILRSPNGQLVVLICAQGRVSWVGVQNAASLQSEVNNLPFLWRIDSEVPQPLKRVAIGDQPERYRLSANRHLPLRSELEVTVGSSKVIASGLFTIEHIPVGRVSYQDSLSTEAQFQSKACKSDR